MSDRWLSAENIAEQLSISKDTPFTGARLDKGLANNKSGDQSLWRA